VLSERSKLKAFQEKIFKYYAQNARIFPWRRTTNAYHILVSEIMLQQTQTDRVVPKYRAFLRLFPTWKALAQAQTAEVITAWQGLGYNRRALNLKRCAEKIYLEHKGKMPQERKALESLPGIGPYTAGALLCFAFKKWEPLIETNIRRAFIHEFFQEQELIHDREIIEVLTKTLTCSQNHTEQACEEARCAAHWFYALMDYGAYLGKTLRTANNPNKKSRHYTRQSKFEGSHRQVRGAILRYLTHNGSTKSSELYEKINVAEAQIKKALKELEAEGFLTIGKTLRLI